MTTSNRVKGRIGVNAVATIVENLWESGWQEYGASNCVFQRSWTPVSV